jgi:hypothetical protein
MGSALEMAPPLIVGRAELDKAVSACAQAIAETAHERGLA